MSQERLHREIIDLSEADDWFEARQEWSLHDVWMSDDPQTCLCGHHPIREICVIENQENGNLTEVGNCCVNNFMGLESESMFSSVRRVMSGDSAAYNEEVIRLLHRRGVINDWSVSFTWTRGANEN